MRQPSRVLWLCAVISFAGLTACESNERERDWGVYGMAEDSLYGRLGGEPTIRAIVNDLVPRTLSNPAVNFTRQGHPRQWVPTEASVAQLKERLVQFLGQATGGPQVYQGAPMGPAHTGMRISGAEFDAFIEDVRLSMMAVGIADELRPQVIALLQTTRPEIVAAEVNGPNQRTGTFRDDALMPTIGAQSDPFWTRRHSPLPHAGQLPLLGDFPGRESSAPGEPIR